MTAMLGNCLTSPSAVLICGFFGAAGCALPARAQTLVVLHTFTGTGGDGATPYAPPVVDPAGSVFGTTNKGGSAGYGTVYKFDPSAGYSVVYSFTNSAGDGAYPWAGLTWDSAGNLYGTTNIGGSYGYGTAFKLDPSGKETVLHSFTDFDGSLLTAGVIRDATGNLYGTTNEGGQGLGVVFKLNPSGHLGEYVFPRSGSAGSTPWGNLVSDRKGNLYGTTVDGGYSGSGTVFMLDAHNHETVLHSFTQSFGTADGLYPYAGLTMDGNGNFYGTTLLGGTFGQGTVFMMDSSGAVTVVYSFTNSDGDGANPYASVVLDGRGNLYGTTSGGGTYGYGTVFKLDPSGKETVLHSFAYDEGSPFGGVVLDKSGDLYGTTYFGGNAGTGYGTLFRVT
jgi:uncharacterized repeat protein (TIGR03803 family)